MPISHDQNFKNLILDYPREALAFLATQEAADLDPTAVITPVRQEQLKDRLGDRFFELDVPLLVEWPNGRREALVFIVEEESDPRRFSILRLASYCLAVADSCRTRRVVPVVVFLRASRGIEQALTLGTERDTYLSFHYIARVLPEIPAEAYLHSDNVVARVNLPLMKREAGQKLAVYHEAIQGLLQLEPDTDRQYKYLDYIDMNERAMHLIAPALPPEPCDGKASRAAKAGCLGKRGNAASAGFWQQPEGKGTLGAHGYVARPLQPTRLRRVRAPCPARPECLSRARSSA